tara:strand:+ start:128 stop:592 length:465 start_codon:yes stop_codon:yes gene_type:complete
VLASVVSLRTIKRLNLLKDDNSFIGRDHKEFAHRAFNTLVDPILRARYILETNGHEWDFRDGTTAEDLSFISELRIQLTRANLQFELENFIFELKGHTTFIIEQIEESIDTYKNYKTAIGLINRFYEISHLHEEATNKKHEVEQGIHHGVFDHN